MKVKFNPDGSLQNKEEILDLFKRIADTPDEDLTEEELLARNFAKSIANIWRTK